jgi:putative endonuclease
MLSKRNARKTGAAGEGKAAAYLQENGYAIIERNWRARSGEIDIIAKQGEALVFAEVKTLPSGGLETAAQELSLRKRQRIIETAKHFLCANRQYNGDYIRFDVLLVDMPEFAPVYHIKNAFSELV